MNGDGMETVPSFLAELIPKAFLLRQIIIVLRQFFGLGFLHFRRCFEVFTVVCVYVNIPIQQFAVYQPTNLGFLHQNVHFILGILRPIVAAPQLLFAVFVFSLRASSRS